MEQPWVEKDHVAAGDRERHDVEGVAVRLDVGDRLVAGFVGEGGGLFVVVERGAGVGRSEV